MWLTMSGLEACGYRASSEEDIGSRFSRCGGGGCEGRPGFCWCTCADACKHSSSPAVDIAVEQIVQGQRSEVQGWGCGVSMRVGNELHGPESMQEGRYDRGTTLPESQVQALGHDGGQAQLSSRKHTSCQTQVLQADWASGGSAAKRHVGRHRV